MEIKTKIEFEDIVSVSPMLEQKKQAVLYISVNGEDVRRTILAQGSMQEIEKAMADMTFATIENHVNAVIKELTTTQRFGDLIQKINNFKLVIPNSEEPKPKRAPRKKALTDSE